MFPSHDPTGHDDLIRYAFMAETNKLLTTYIPWLEKGMTPESNPPLNLRPNVLVKSGRASGGQEHQLPRSLGVRECIIARPGHVLISSDYESGELFTHGQNCLDYVGFSKLADALNAGTKVHDLLGCEIAGIPYTDFLSRKGEDKFLRDCRQSAKPINFGCPGLMGAATLVAQQRKQEPDTPAPDGSKIYKGLRFCLLTGGEQVCGHTMITEWKGRPVNPVCLRCVETAEKLRNIWFDLFPENHKYFELAAEIADSENPELMQPWSGRIRGESKICSIANSPFQGRLADAMKLATCRVQDEAFCAPQSDVYGSRVILVAHDEIVAEAPEEQAHEAGERIAAIMVEALSEVCPDMRTIAAEPALMRRWYKGADQARDSNGRLIPWEPSE